MQGVLDKARSMLRSARRAAKGALAPQRVLERRPGEGESQRANRPIPIPQDLDAALCEVEGFIGTSSGLKIRRLTILEVPAAILYIEEIVDRSRLETGVVAPLILEAEKLRRLGRKDPVTPDLVVGRVAVAAQTKRLNDIRDIVWSVLDSAAVVVAAGWRQAVSLQIPGTDRRAVVAPEMEVTVRGPREGFVERIDANVGLIRYRLKHPRLRIVNLTVGRYTRSKVAVLYVEGLARVEVVAEAVSRIKRIDIDAVVDSGQVEEFIEDSPLSPFPQVGSTERPDHAVGGLVQGRVVILVDSSPFALIVPFPGISFLQSAEDYYQRWVASLITRTIRLISVLVALFLPSAYVAFTTFHQEVIPRSLALAIAVQREMVPYPAIVEALALTLVFEIVTEASIRLPRPMGLTIGIVGTLVIGESAVRANLISNVMVIVIAATALAQFTIMHPMTVTVRLLRLPILLLSSTLGLFGIFFATIAILLHLSSLRTFGEPYLTPYAPALAPDMKDTTLRLPIWAQVTRPSLEATRNLVRQPPGQRPRRPSRESDVLELEAVETRKLSENPPKAQDEIVSGQDDGLGRVRRPKPASKGR